MNESHSPRRYLRAEYDAIFAKTASLSAWYTAGPRKCSSEWGDQQREILEAQDYVGPVIGVGRVVELEGRGPGGMKRQVGSTGEG